MARKFPTEFRDDVVRVALSRDAGTSIASVARDFGVSETCLYKWLEKAEEKSKSAGSGDTAELRRIKKRNRVLEQENEILRRAAAFFAKDVSPK